MGYSALQGDACVVLSPPGMWTFCVWVRVRSPVSRQLCGEGVTGAEQGDCTCVCQGWDLRGKDKWCMGSSEGKCC